MRLDSSCSAARAFLGMSTLVLAAVTGAASQTLSANAQTTSRVSMLDQGMLTLQSNALKLTLVHSSGTVAALSPRLNPSIDYTPGDLLKARSANAYYHLGDLDLRLQAGTLTTPEKWKDYSTAYHRQPVKTIASDAHRLVSDLSPTLPADIPLKVVRTWAVEPSQAGSTISLHFTLANRTKLPVHIGGFGIPMIFNNIMNDRTLEQSYAKCSFYDPYIGEDAGYVQVVRLDGRGPVLLILPERHTPLEAWKPILDKRAAKNGPALPGNDPTPRSATFEGSFDWLVHSTGFAQTDWTRTTGKQPDEWNPPTETVLAPGQAVTYGLRFVVAPDVRSIEDTLTRNSRPVAIGVPGYILPEDINARLFLRYQSPVRSIVSEPSGAIDIHDDGLNANHDHAYTLRGTQWGRARLVVTYADGTLQTIAYRTIKPESETVTDMGHFLFHDQWFTDKSDPFHRAPSIISYDNATGSQVTQESRVWIAGLSDEAGAGSWLAAAMKEFVAPDAGEVAKLESFVDGVLWGGLQVNDGEHKYGVHKSLFYYQPDALPTGYYDTTANWKSWTSWNRQAAADVGRSFNYPHVVAAYWSLYRIARLSEGVAKAHEWQWYLTQAYETSLAMQTQAPYYAQFGQMEGTVFIRLLDDLKREGWADQATKLEAVMRARAEGWRAKQYPFGSEMPWDSTGQEEVYGWSRYFNFDDKAAVTVNAVLAYTPVLPSWGYNGSARRYWDFLYGGKYPRIERQLHHYGSGINAIPLLSEYRRHPDDLYLLRAGYGGLMGPLANIDQKGFASAAFHSFPDRMAIDPYSGDYGPNFFGFAINTSSYLVKDAKLGWLAFGGNVSQSSNLIQLVPLDALRQRIYIAPVGLWLTLDSGRFRSIAFNAVDKSVSIAFDPASEAIKVARLRIERTSDGHAARHYQPAGTIAVERGAYVIPLTQETTLTLTDH